MVKKNACIFISGHGSNLRSLIKNSRDHSFPINIKLIISNNANAKGIFHAKKKSLPFLIINTKKRNFENIILKEIKKYNISLICLAGYMKVLSKNFIKNYGKKIINIHPSLLPKFKGLNTFERILKNNEKKTGCTVHFVNEKLDSGKIIIQKIFFINKNDNIKNLKEKTQKLEQLAFPEAIRKIYRYN
ncbi:phosphoribosylglycinamide formyltransferase [Pelagibacteraceae bacterium]|jgi:phosphoribosylglycinamide formyltransferase-1|nr:phosphoribosylglycinamide formyltransferase [Pelagibacteraceae bacterium]